MKPSLVLAAATAALVVSSSPRPARAHCDTLGGPVVKDARAALDSKDVTPVLKWVRPDKEAEIREVFRRALAVRALGPEALALADHSFFETVVRVHREGEGAPYTGLKPADQEIDPAIAASDSALDAGSVDSLAKLLTTRVDQGIRQRFRQASEARMHAGESVDKGREYVAAYVEFVHYAERLLRNATGTASDEEHGATPAAHQAAEHLH